MVPEAYLWHWLNSSCEVTKDSAKWGVVSGACYLMIAATYSCPVWLRSTYWIPLSLNNLEYFWQKFIWKSGIETYKTFEEPGWYDTLDRENEWGDWPDLK